MYMKFLKIKPSWNNTILESSDSAFPHDASADTIQVSVETFSKPSRQPNYFYRWDDTNQRIEPNTEQYIEYAENGGVSYKIYKFLENVKKQAYNLATPPFDINYDILGLFKKRTFLQGELVEVCYFENYDFDNDIYDNLIVKEIRNFYRRNELIYQRELKITWYLDDNTEGKQRIYFKKYTVDESVKAGERRRSNIISKLKIDIVGLIQIVESIDKTTAEQKGFAYLIEIDYLINLYKEGVIQPLIDSVTNNPATVGTSGEFLAGVIPGLNITIKAYIVNSLTLDYTTDTIYG